MTQPYFEFFSPVKLVAGHKALEHIAFELETRGAARPMLVSDPGVVPPAPSLVSGGNGHSGSMSLPRAAPTVEFPGDETPIIKGSATEAMASLIAAADSSMRW